MALRTLKPELKRIYHLNYVSKPETRLKLRSREQCAYAIRTGKLVRQPCEQCGKPKSEAHHEDYSKPLNVRWLCRSCHAAVHRGTTSKSKSHCPHGHAYTPENRINGTDCRECHNARQRKKWAKQISPAQLRMLKDYAEYGELTNYSDFFLRSKSFGRTNRERVISALIRRGLLADDLKERGNQYFPKTY